jgi:hypothetical protein
MSRNAVSRAARRCVIEMLESRQLLSALPVIAAAPLAAAPLGAAPPVAAVLAANTAAPEILLPYLNKTGNYRLTQDTSDVVVISFYQTTEPLAVQTIQQVQTVSTWALGFNVNVMGIDTLEDQATAQNFLLAHPELTLPVLMDAPAGAPPTSGTATDYDVQVTPVTYVIARRGTDFTIAFVHNGFDGGLVGKLENEITALLAVPSIRIEDVTVTEGNTTNTLAVFQVTLSKSLPQDLYVDYTTVPGTAVPFNASQPPPNGDYVTTRSGAAIGTKLKIAKNTTSATISVPIVADTIPEDPAEEFFSVVLSNPQFATPGSQFAPYFIKDTALGTIVDNDTPPPPPTVFLDNVEVRELAFSSTNATLHVYLDSVSATDVTIKYTAAEFTALDVDASGNPLVDALHRAKLNIDFGQKTGVATIKAGKTTADITIPILPTITDNPDKLFKVVLTEPTNCVLWTDTGATPVAGAYAMVTIHDRNRWIQVGDPVNAISGDVALSEGNTGTTAFQFPITLTTGASFPVTVDWYTASGTAQAGSASNSGGDFIGANGTITFPAADPNAPDPTVPVTQYVTVYVKGDTVQEPDETFTINLTNSRDAQIDPNLYFGTGTIMDDGDQVPAISIADAAPVPEGDDPNVPRMMTFHLTIPADARQNEDITVDYATADDTAVAGVDYTATHGTATIHAGATSTIVQVPILGNTVNQPNRQFMLLLSNPQPTGVAMLANDTALGTIIDNDPVSISAQNVSMPEGNSGTTNMTFTVTLSRPSTQTITVAYNTTDGTATAGSDYQAKSGTLTFPAVTNLNNITTANTTQTVVVPIFGDTTPEATETFTLNLSNASFGAINTPAVTGTITDDDSIPAIKVMQGSKVITNSPKAQVSFGTVALNAKQPAKKFTVTNTGTGALNLAGLSVPGGFKVTEKLNATLAPGQSDTFTVNMLTNRAGTFKGTLRFTTNVPGITAYYCGISGVVKASKLAAKKKVAAKAAKSAISLPVAAVMSQPMVSQAQVAGLFATDATKAIRPKNWVF